VAQEIARSEVAKNAPAEAVSFNKVPLTGFEASGKFPPEYYPDAAVNYINGWKLVGAKIAESASKPRGGLLSPSDVTLLYEKTKKPIEDYQREYVGYWRDDLRQKLAVVPLPAWNRIFAGDDLKGGQWEVRALANIQDIDDKAYKALEQIRPTLVPAVAQAVALQPPLTPREYARLEERSRVIVARWRALGDDAQAARLTVIGLAPAVFESAYIFPDDQQARLPERYVAEFSYRMLEALALEAGNIARKAFENLRQLNRFPLARPAKGAGVLTIKDIEDAREYLAKIKLDPNVDAPAGAAIAREASKVEQQLRTLRGLELNRDDKLYLDRVQAVLKMIPEKGKQLRCTISFLNKDAYKTHVDATKKRVPFDTYPYGELIQTSDVPVGKWPHTRELTEAADPKALGQVVCPGEPIRFRVSSFATFEVQDKPYVWPPVGDTEYNASAPWSLLRLLHGDNVLYRSEDGRIWHVELPVEQGASFWLKLEFDIKAPGIPDVKDWPEKKATP
jgi:hypothetical protein